MFMKTNVNLRTDLYGGMRCIKYMLLTSNVMFLFIGFLIISIATTILAIYQDFDIFLATYFFDPAYLLFTIGVITLIVASFGCVGVIKESTLLVNLYAFFLGLILLLEVGVTFSVYHQQNTIGHMIFERMDTTMYQYYVSHNAQASWDFLQSRMQCCGINDFTDWNGKWLTNGTEVEIMDSDNLSTTKFYIPSSCCVTESCKFPYLQGCMTDLVDIVTRCSEMLQAGAICVSIAQFLGVIFAYMLAKAIRRAKTERAMKLYNTTAPIVDEKGPGIVFVQTVGEASA